MLPIMRKQERTKAIIGDNLSSHINFEVLRLSTKCSVLPTDEEPLAKSSSIVEGECSRKSVHINSKGTLSNVPEEVTGEKFFHSGRRM
ncbi:hypothetical protein PR048_025817 [Dryococelus australis]|uniref:DDE-1 domain-containing protein n=1 Tax=Dryococelus australis TaxID=614101 RepID=A0ABQ9GJM6_9NEOP|nr:hypothetical protein PR048_025817 [Dryococelus australis]